MGADRLERFRNAVGDDRSLDVSPHGQVELALVLLEAGLERRRRGGPLVLVGSSQSNELAEAAEDARRGGEILETIDELLAVLSPAASKVRAGARW